MGEETRNDFFRLPGFLSLIIIPFLLVLLTLSVLAPQYVPFAYLGPLGSFSQLLAFKYPAVLKGIFYTTILLHAFEAFYAVRLARSKNLMDNQVTKWGIVAGIYGIFAVKYLLSYEPPKPKIA